MSEIDKPPKVPILNFDNSKSKDFIEEKLEREKRFFDFFQKEIEKIRNEKRKALIRYGIMWLNLEKENINKVAEGKIEEEIPKVYGEYLRKELNDERAMELIKNSKLDAKNPFLFEQADRQKLLNYFVGDYRIYLNKKGEKVSMTDWLRYYYLDKTDEIKDIRIEFGKDIELIKEIIRDEKEGSSFLIKEKVPLPYLIIETKNGETKKVSISVDIIDRFEKDHKSIFIKVGGKKPLDILPISLIHEVDHAIRALGFEERDREALEILNEGLAESAFLDFMKTQAGDILNQKECGYVYRYYQNLDDWMFCPLPLDYFKKVLIIKAIKAIKGENFLNRLFYKKRSPEVEEELRNLNEDVKIFMEEIERIKEDIHNKKKK